MYFLFGRPRGWWLGEGVGVTPSDVEVENMGMAGFGVVAGDVRVFLWMGATCAKCIRCASCASLPLNLSDTVVSGWYLERRNWYHKEE